MSHFDVMHWRSHAKIISVQKISKDTRPVVKIFLLFTSIFFFFLILMAIFHGITTSFLFPERVMFIAAFILGEEK